MTSIQSVIFDLDGTLLDREQSLVFFIEDQHNRLHKNLGSVPRDLYARRFIQLDARGYVWKDRVYSRLIDEFKIESLTVDYLLQDYLDNFPRHCVPFPNLHETLTALKQRKLKLGIITNGRTDFQKLNIASLGIQNFFEVVLVSEEQGIKKPDAEIFRRAVDKLGVFPEESVFVGDHPVNDVLAAQNIGMRALWKRDRFWQSDVTSDATIDDLSEIISWVESRK